MREIVLDTETTGLDPKDGHRIVEIGCVELLNHMPTGGELHLYINPERDMPAEAFRVHGLSEEFLADKPLFADIAQTFVDFVGDDPLVIHNASFDMKFLNAELAAVGRPTLPMDRAIDTLRMAQRKFPGAQTNLDALCRRFGIDNSARTHHGALLDSLLLAEVYLELIGGREPGLALQAEKEGGLSRVAVNRPQRAPRPHAASAGELAAHAAFLEKVKDPIWAKMMAPKDTAAE
jgi:DNA polymerase-3 subunit epsilon